MHKTVFFIKKFDFLIGIILFSFLFRLITVYFFRDNHLDNEWQILVNNLISYKSYSFYTFDNQIIPSAYMPPLYAFLIYSVKIITFFEETNLVYSIIFLQILLSVYSVYLFYQINQSFFSQKLSLINSFIFSIVPLNIYSCGQISSINLQIFLSLLFLKFLILLIKKEEIRNIIFFSITSGLLILTRGEFLLIFILIVLFILYRKKIAFNSFIKILIIVLLIISPYVTRNYINFNQIFVVKSLGYNLWKGNNELSQVEGYENLKKSEFNKLYDEINNINKDKLYEIKRDKVFLEEAIYNITNNPLYYFKQFVKKFISYYFIDIKSNYPSYYNFFHVIPIFLISLLSFPGLFTFFKTNQFERKCLGLYIFLNIFIFSIFFILPRYKLIILPMQIILASNFITYMLKKYAPK